MNEVLHANIFFIIASFGVVVFIILVSLILYQVLKVVKSIRKIVTRIEVGSKTIAEDITNLRSFVLEGSIFSQLLRYFMPKSRSKKHRRSAEDDDDE